MSIRIDEIDKIVPDITSGAYFMVEYTENSQRKDKEIKWLHFCAWLFDNEQRDSMGIWENLSGEAREILVAEYISGNE